jgi:hypothetical protein
MSRWEHPVIKWSVLISCDSKQRARIGPLTLAWTKAHDNTIADSWQVGILMRAGQGNQYNDFVTLRQ